MADPRMEAILQKKRERDRRDLDAKAKEAADLKVEEDLENAYKSAFAATKSSIPDVLKKLNLSLETENLRLVCKDDPRPNIFQIKLERDGVASKDVDFFNASYETAGKIRIRMIPKHSADREIFFEAKDFDADQLESAILVFLDSTV